MFSVDNDDQTYHMSNNLRELGQLSVHMKKSNLVTNFSEIINPKKFPEVIKSITEIAIGMKLLKQWISLNLVLRLDIY